jgi:hypothetical protein
MNNLDYYKKGEQNTWHIKRYYKKSMII